MIDRDPGIYSDIPNDDYHGGPGVSKSGLDILARSPLHFRYRQDAANDNTSTAAQRIGSAAHCLILEPKEFGSRYAVAPDVDRRTKEGKSLWAEFVEDHPGATILTDDEMQTLAGMAAAVHMHPAAAALLNAPALVEASCYWRDPGTDLLCRCRPDFWRDDGIIVDLKTTEDASPDAFAKSIAEWRYHVQVAMYLDGAGLAIDQGCPGMRDLGDFVFIAVEKKPPHAVAVYRLDDDDVRLGRELYRRDLQTLRLCTDEDQWPAYGDDVQRIGLPGWYRARMLGGGL